MLQSFKQMGLNSGTKLGPYEVIASLGAGGMGEVYRARDAKLGRDVALKVLPEGFSADAQRMGRFEREAQVLASMNHPNIAAIYGLEESTSVRALVMELVEGATLDELLETGKSKTETGRSKSKSGNSIDAESASQSPVSGFRFPVSGFEPLPIARQIAEALEYAHERGIIHRDLKPANIKITPDGQVKVLDFGLAKALDATASGSAPSGPGAVYDSPLQNSPTLTSLATQAGMIIGTAAYMSPEQARGKSVDRRADIWAFGCVLYEMFSGKRLFGGETVSDTLAAVIMKEPEWETLPASVPPAIQKLIRRCLTKDPKQRLRDIGEARITIEETIVGVGAIHESPLPVSPASSVQPQAPPRSTLQRALPWAAGFAAGALIAALAAFFLLRPTEVVQPIRSLIAPPEKSSFAFGQPSGAPMLSPNGTRMVFPVIDDSGKESLWVRPLGSLTASRLEGTEGAEFPFWSPDSRYVGFFQSGKLEKIDVTGGPPVQLCDAPGARGGAWSRKEVIIFATQNLGGGLASVPAAGGSPAPLTANKGSGGGFSNRWPVFLPDGKHFLYLSGDLSAPGTPSLNIYVGELGTDQAKVLLQADSDALYAAPGYLLFLRGETLMAQGFDAGSQKLEGEAFPIAERVGSPQLYRLGLFSASQTGFLVFENGVVGSGGGQLVWVDANGKESGTVGQPGPVDPHLSPDGKQLVYSMLSPEGKGADLWLMDLARDVRTRFTFGPLITRYPIWSPDGTRVAFASVRNTYFNLYVKNTSGSGNVETLLESDTQKFPGDWSRDGKFILYTSVDNKEKTQADIFVLPLFGDRKPYPYLQTKFNEGPGVFSPDGHWVAYSSDESGSGEIYLSTFPAGGAKYQVSQGGGLQPQWSHDGSAILYVSPGGKLMQVSVKEKGSAVEIGSPRELFHMPMSGIAPGTRAICITPDGKRFLVSKAEQGASPPLTLVANWTAGIKN